ncbi:MAG: hypothetical protein K8R40_08095 [Anaerolineaceae bacterium]|nr:hypothetical protein [Anaerolineaceae bacterium]
MPQNQFITVDLLTQWTEQLTALSKNPLEFIPDFPQIAARFEAWWEHDCLDRPIFVASTNSNPERPVCRRWTSLKNPGIGSKKNTKICARHIGRVTRCPSFVLISVLFL